MNYWLSLGFIPEADQLVEISAFAEELGFFGVTLPDHLVLPSHVASKYPYSTDGAMFWDTKTPWPDPWVMMGAIGARTTTLQMTTNIYLGALRHPFVTASSVATASMLSGGRVACGMAVGWMREEYAAAGVEFATRGRRLNETIDVLRALWSGDAVSHEGEFYSFDEVTSLPTPAKPVPVWLGGGSRVALRRAAKRGDGWLGLVYTPEELEQVVPELLGYRAEFGRAEDPFDILVGLNARQTPEMTRRLEELGVTGLVSSPFFMTDRPTETLDAKKRVLEKYAKYVLEPCG